MKRFLISILTVMLLFPLASAFSAAAVNANPAPTVIPAVREWTGGNGRFTLKKGAAVVLASAGVLSENRISVIKAYFKDMLDFDIAVKSGVAASSGDISLVIVSDGSYGDEAYKMEVKESGITIEAGTEQGLFYGIITVLQSLCADGYVPVGTAVDYPAYPIRSGMIDVARAYLPLDYVEEITKYMAWFKLNEVHLHINDLGDNGYAIFRLESDIPGLAAKDGYYGKDEYRDYQKRMLNYGISVITEIDTPAHSSCFYGIIPDEYMFDQYHININNPDAVQFIKDLFDEYITGDDPVFVSKKVHFGTDEFPAGHNEQMRAYTDELIKHINSRGYTPRFWGAFGNDGFNGNTPVSSDAECNFWATSLSDYKTLFDMGYDVINTCGPVLYVVPGGNYGFADYYNLDAMYKTWYVNYMGYGASPSVAHDNPQLKGASFALWNDRHTCWGGFSMFDIFDRLRGQTCFISEKTWCGEQTREIDSSDFVERFNRLSWRAGNTNPGRYQKLPISGSDLEGIDSVGFPYRFSMEIKLNSYNHGNTVLLSGKDGQFYASPNGTIGFKRETYTFTYDYKVPLNTWVKLTLFADNEQTVLIVDDTYYYFPINNNNRDLLDSATFVLPLESVCKDIDGEYRNLLVETPDQRLDDNRLDMNHAFKCNVTVSALEVDYGILNEPLAVDGDQGTRLSFSRDKDYQWMVVDLGSVKKVNRVVIDFFERVTDYKLSVSIDGENYTEVNHTQGGKEGARQADTISFDVTDARYIKYEQLKRHFVSAFNTWYSGGIVEFEVYGYDKDKYDSALTRAKEIYQSPDTVASEVSGIRKAANALSVYMKKDKLFATHIDALLENLENAIYAYENPKTEESSEPVFVLSEPGSEDSATSLSPSEQAKTLPWIIGGAAAGAIAVAAAVIMIIKRKKK